MNAQDLTILAIDDHQDNLITLQAVVGDALPGARVLAALDGWRGIELARTGEPDVILLDIVMPGLDGFETCRRLKSDESLRHIPVVFLTALRTDRQSRVMALEAGAEGFLTKPLDETELTAQIRAMAKIKAASDAKRQESQRLASLVAQRTRDLEHQLTQRRLAEESLRQAAREESQAALRQSEEKYRGIYETIQDVYFETSLDGTILELSPSVERLSQFTRQELIGASILNMYAISAERQEVVERLLGSEIINDFEISFRDKDGRVVPCSLSAMLAMGEDGRPKKICGVLRDISERKRAEMELRQSQAFNASIIASSADCIKVLDLEGRLKYMSPGGARMMGLADLKTVLDLPYQQFWRQPDLENVRQALESARRGGQGGFQGYCPTADGQPRWWDVTVTPILDAGGQVENLLAVSRDVTENRRAQEALRHSEEKYRSLFENMLNGFAYCRMLYEDGRPVDFIYLDVNKAFERLTGLRDVIGRRISEVIPGLRQSNPELLEIYGRVAQTGQPAQFETYVKALDMWFAVSVYSPQKEHFVAVFDVVTERKQAEEALRKSEELLRLVTDHIYDWEYWINPALELLFVSPSCQSITGYQPREFMADVGLLDRIVHPDDQVLWREHLEQYRVGEGFKRQGQGIEFRILAKDGQPVWISHRCRPVFGSDGCFLGRRVSNRDITRRKQAESERAELEAQLRQAQKMEAIGTLAGGIAHDFNNILAAVLGFAEMAREDARSGPVSPTDLDQIISSAQRAKELVHKILAFSRKKEPDLKPLSLNKVVQATGGILERTLPKMIGIETRLGEDLPPVLADPTQVEQVLLNLASNAQDAMAEGGRLLMETQTIVLDQDYCRRHLEVRPGAYVLLMVSDTGAGMDAQTREHIFEPFFTTKDIGKGTGLGLSSAYGIVKNHGGHIHCYSEPGQGTVFKMYLPAYQAAASPPPPPEALDEAALAGSEGILLVDD
ncbi:MAG: PAS domain S-box protein, partial [Desulfarculus sp.]|nr:PAS domain S-box protein [Desulfarculus sp.]